MKVEWRSPLKGYFRRLMRCTKYRLIITLCVTTIIVYYNTDDVSRAEIDLININDEIQREIKIYKGKGCNFPKIDPFSREAMKFFNKSAQIVCDGINWVDCNISECRVVDEILKAYGSVSCTYRDIIYVNDWEYVYGDPVKVSGADKYVLQNSDHAKVFCSKGGTNLFNFGTKNSWDGVVSGFRPVVKVFSNKKETLNCLILAFDSASHNGVIRSLPKTFAKLNELEAVILNGYTVVGSGTHDAIFPLLTGKRPIEHPDAEIRKGNTVKVDAKTTIFNKLNEIGFRTSYMEDMPYVGTFTYYYNGFNEQPADHYNRAFNLESSKKQWRLCNSMAYYCVGGIPKYAHMLQLTKQFFTLDGPRFAFTFIADISHDDFNLITNADDDVVSILDEFKETGRFDDTVLIVMGDHGSRFCHSFRETYVGRMEERMPFFSIILPERLKSARPLALASLKKNVNVLTTPFDVHATLLDVLLGKRYSEEYGKNRGMTLIKPIPNTRSCSEAEIVPHWCVCIQWRSVPESDDKYHKSANFLENVINDLLTERIDVCEPRSIETIDWVQNDAPQFTYVKSNEIETNYQVKAKMSPDDAVFEATMQYHWKNNSFTIRTSDISRVNMYGNSSACVKATHPHLCSYCYCKQ